MEHRSVLTIGQAQEKREWCREHCNSDCTKDLAEIREWFKAALTPNSREGECYRILGPSLLDEDIVACLPAFVPKRDLGFGPLESQYVLRQLWVFLFRRYAFSEAKAVAGSLSEERHWFNRVWRFKDWLLWRLMVGIFAGFLLLGSNSSLIQILDKAHECFRWQVAILGLCLAFSFFIVFFDLERRIGCAGWRVMVPRLFHVLVRALIYACLGGLVQYFGARSLGFIAPREFVVLCSAAAIVLGFLFQLIWQEHSIGDPL